MAHVDEESRRLIRRAYLRDMFFSRTGRNGYLALIYAVGFVTATLYMPRDYIWGVFDGCALTYTVLFLVTLVRSMYRFFKQLRQLQANPTSYALDERGFTATNGENALRLPWGDVSGAKIHHQCLVLRLKTGMRYLIPTKVAPAEAIAFMLSKTTPIARTT